MITLDRTTIHIPNTQNISAYGPTEDGVYRVRNLEEGEYAGIWVPADNELGMTYTDAFDNAQDAVDLMMELAYS